MNYEFIWSDTMDLIIGIVTYNNQSIIKKTISNVIENISGMEYKIVVYDNASDDNTLKILEQIKNDKIKVINGRVNRGFGFGHNQIIKEYDAEYYLIYNPDIILRNHIIEELYCFMQKNRNISMITPKIVYPNGEIQYLCKKNPTVFDLLLRRFTNKTIKKYFRGRLERYEMRYTGYNKVFMVPYATGCFMFFRGSVLKQIKGFDDNIFMYLEDADITRRANIIAPCMFYPYNYVEHLWQRGSHKSIYLTWINIKSAIYYFNKWGWKLW